MAVVVVVGGSANIVMVGVDGILDRVVGSIPDQVVDVVGMVVPVGPEDLVVVDRHRQLRENYLGTGTIDQVEDPHAEVTESRSLDRLQHTDYVAKEIDRR